MPKKSGVLFGAVAVITVCALAAESAPLAIAASRTAANPVFFMTRHSIVHSRLVEPDRFVQF
jgi:hypothetical protein